MVWLLLWLHVLALAAWLGETIFFSLVVAPALFGTLPVEEAGRITSLLFPGYYIVGYVSGALLVATGFALWRRSRPAGVLWLVSALIAVVSLVACLYAGVSIQPRAAALRPQLHDPAAPVEVRAEFDALHDRAVQLNVAVLIGTLAIAGLLAAQMSGGVRGARRLSRYGSDPLL